MTDETNFHLLVGDAWLPLTDVEPDFPITLDRPSSSFLTLGGTKYIQIAPKANRSWQINYPEDDAISGKWLDYAATNPGEVWLCDTAAAQVNMLDPATTKGLLAAAALIVVDDGPTMKAFAAGDSFTRKLRSGVYYHLSFTTTHTAGATIGTYDLGAGTVNIVAPVGTGARRGSLSFLTTADGDVDVVWTVADKTTAARLTETSVDTAGWLEGRNTPCQVSVSDPSQTATDFYRDRLARGAFSYTIQEVG